AAATCFSPDSFAGLPPVGAYYLKKVFVWVPEYIWDGIEYIPCPHCDERAQPDGWNTEPRRVFLEDDVCYLIGYRCATVTSCRSLDI
ncbi:unnamed protein product, partial [Ectocarpus sp. 8 AP-2014]